MTEETKQEVTEDIVTAFEIQATSDKGIDYDKLIDKYGCFKLDEPLKQRIMKLTGKPMHRFMRRGIFFCQRDLKECLDSYEKKKPFYLYTGRGPSAGALHMGHCVPMLFTKWLQEAFDVPLVIQITDDEKYIYRPELELDGPNGTLKMARENIKDIIAFGFDLEKTFIFNDTEYIQHLYPNVIRVQKHVNFNQIKGIFGFNESDAVGKFAFPAVQAAPAFSSSFPHIFGTRKTVPCLIPAAIDQDPYFRMTRDIAQKLKYSKPASIYSTFFPALQGKKTKMSSSDPNSGITLIDTMAEIKKKVNKYAFSGGQQTLEEQREKGADLEVDVPYQYLTFFLEDDDKLKEIGDKYSSGEMTTGEIKAILIEVIQAFVKDFQAKRAKVTDEDVRKFCEIRKIEAMPKAWIKATAGNAPSNAGTQAKPSAGNVKLYVKGKEMPSNSILIAGDLASTPVATVKVTPELEKQFKGQLFPAVDCSSDASKPVLINEKIASCSYILRNNQEYLGMTAFEQAKVDSFLSIFSEMSPQLAELYQGVFSGKKSEDNAELMKKLKDACKMLDGHMKNNEWFCNDRMTLADIIMFEELAPAFQTLLDGGFRKAMGSLSAWFEKMAQLPCIVRRFGYIKVCEKVCK